MNDSCMLVITEAINMIATFGAAIIGGLITGGFILLAAIIAYKGGLKTYFKEREHEQIMKRYLEDGVDRVQASASHALEVFYDNYRMVLNVVRSLRNIEVGLHLEKEDYLPKFRQTEQHCFTCVPFMKVQHLVGDKIFWEFVQLLYAFVDGKSIRLEKDFRMTVENVVEGKVEDISIQDLLDKTKEEIDEQHEESKKYHWILVELQTISFILERETSITWGDLSKFKDKPEIKESVKKLKGIFAEINSECQKPSKNNK